MTMRLCGKCVNHCENGVLHDCTPGGCVEIPCPNCADKEPSMFVPKEGKVLIRFGAAWCAPCKGMEPALQNLEKEGVNVMRVDVDVYEKLRDDYKVMSVPTFVFMKDGEERSRMVGKQSFDALKTAYDAA